MIAPLLLLTLMAYASAQTFAPVVVTSKAAAVAAATKDPVAVLFKGSKAPLTKVGGIRLEWAPSIYLGYTSKPATNSYGHNYRHK